MLTHLGGNRYEFLMQLLIIKDLLVAVVDSYEGLPTRKTKEKTKVIYVMVKLTTRVNDSVWSSVNDDTLNE